MTKRIIDSSAYLERAISLFKQTTSYPDSLYYCALELRCCIERLSFEYLYMAKNKKISKKDVDLYSCSKITEKIHNIIGDFESRMDFLNIILKAHFGNDIELIPIPDFEILKKHYNNLSSYIHAPRLIPSNTENTTSSYSPLIGYSKDAINYLRTLLSKNRNFVHFNQNTSKIYKSFKNRKLSEEDVIKLLRKSITDTN